MKKFNFKEEILPHLIAVTIFLLITFIFYSPLFFESKTLNQHDITQGLGGGQELREYRESTGENALWTNSMFGGMPAYLISLRWDGNLITYVEKVITLGLTSTPAVTFTSFLSFYFLLLVFGVRPYLAIAGAIAYGLSSFNIISIAAGHIWKMRAMAYMPLVLGGVHLLFTDRIKKLYAISILALGFALEIKANHLQITYYLLILLLIYGINALIIAIRQKELPGLFKNVAFVIAAGLIALGCNFGQLWATYEYGQYSTRGKSDLTTSESNGKSGLDKEYVFRWSSGKLESLTFLIPNLYGGSSTESLLADTDSNTLRALQRSNNPQAQQLARYASGYWGEQPGTSPIYVGAIVCFLFLLGMVILEGHTKYWMLGGVVLSLMLSWGHNFASFNDFMYYSFPLYNKFRAVTMVLVIALMLMPLLGFMALEKVLTMNWSKETQRYLLIALAGTGGLCLFLILVPNVLDFNRSIEDQLPPWLSGAMALDRKSLLQQDAWRSLIFIVLSAGVVFVSLKGKLNELLGAVIIVVLIASDLWVVDRRYLNENNYKRKARNFGFSPSQADQRIEQDNALHYRVLNLIGTWNEAQTSYYHSSIGGYHGAKMRRYQELVERCLDDQKAQIISRLQTGSTDFSNAPVLNMLNARYIKFGDKAQQVIQNTSAYGNAWIAQKILQVNSADDEINETCQIREKGTAVVDIQKFELSSSDNVQGTVTMTEYTPDRLTYQANLNDKGLVVFSEIYYPEGWTAYIDGQESPVLRANYVLRALQVPAGTHEIVFEFKPDAYYTGNAIMATSSGILILLLIGSAFLSLRKPTDA